MVASSVVTTIMVLNYHHRLVDTHEMPDWVGKSQKKKEKVKAVFLSAGSNSFSAVASLVAAHVQTRGENNQKVNTDAEEDEGVRQERNSF